MNALKNILARFCAVWALLCFVITMIPTVILVWIFSHGKEPRRSQRLQIVFSGWMKAFFVLAGVRRKYVGRQYFAKGETYIVTCNHRSFMDPPMTTPAIIAPNRTIAKVEMARIPVFGIIYKRGSVLVDRKSEESRKQSYLQMKEVLSRGLHMCIYPEGTRNKTAQPLLKFHDGAFKLAVDTGRPVMPALIFGTAEVLPPGKGFYFWPRNVEMHFLPPVSSLNKSTQQLKEEVYRVMEAYYVRNKG